MWTHWGLGKGQLGAAEGPRLRCPGPGCPLEQKPLNSSALFAPRCHRERQRGWLGLSEGDRSSPGKGPFWPTPDQSVEQARAQEKENGPAPQGYYF